MRNIFGIIDLDADKLGKLGLEGITRRALEPNRGDVLGKPESSD